ncbi:MAG TPA: AraC family transcriptional regulator ligand-binding domain-containing protein [Noviherbaspirillum sp.]|nr:AraC family transcriptional regulator ligand-binding domain-containing protein [Noviherbaspirillum sp.]
MVIPAYWQEPVFHPTYARLLCMLLRQRGVPTQSLLDSIGLTWAELVNSGRDTSFAEMRSLVLAALRFAGQPALGMELGALIPASAHGPVGYAALASKDVAQAVDVITRYGKLRARAIEFRLVRRGPQFGLQIRESFDLADVRIPILEAILMLVVTLFEALLGHALDEVEYRFPYPAPPWAERYTSRLNGKVLFDAGHMEIRMPEIVLAEPCLTSDAIVYASAVRDCEMALARLTAEEDVPAQVRRQLQGRDEGYPSCEEMAAQLHMSARTLIRHLSRHGTSYQALLDEVRKERAHWYLRHTGHPVEQIAERLGYLDTSNFSRTFRRWYGTSPKAYRLAGPQSATPESTQGN